MFECQLSSLFLLFRFIARGATAKPCQKCSKFGIGQSRRGQEYNEYFCQSFVSLSNQLYGTSLERMLPCCISFCRASTSVRHIKSRSAFRPKSQSSANGLASLHHGESPGIRDMFECSSALSFCFSVSLHREPQQNHAKGAPNSELASPRRARVQGVHLPEFCQSYQLYGTSLEGMLPCCISFCRASTSVRHIKSCSAFRPKSQSSDEFSHFGGIQFQLVQFWISTFLIPLSALCQQNVVQFLII